MSGWSVVFTGPKFEAEVVAASLEAAGLDARVLTDTGDYFPGAGSDSRVMVPEDQVAAARTLIAAD